MPLQPAHVQPAAQPAGPGPALRHVCFVARDFAVDYAFFTHTLRLDVAAAVVPDWARFRAGNVQFLLAGTALQTTLPAGAQVPVLAVDDVAATAAGFAAQGAVVSELAALADIGGVTLVRSTGGTLLLLCSTAAAGHALGAGGAIVGGAGGDGQPGGAAVPGIVPPPGGPALPAEPSS
jgi:hypothetical protein